jgi:hypothetical protein
MHTLNGSFFRRRAGHYNEWNIQVAFLHSPERKQSAKVRQIISSKDDIGIILKVSEVILLSRSQLPVRLEARSSERVEQEFGFLQMLFEYKHSQRRHARPPYLILWKESTMLASYHAMLILGEFLLEIAYQTGMKNV